MALEPRVDLVEGVELGDREVAAQYQDRVQADGGMALREDEPIPVRPVRPRGVDPEDAEIEGRKDVRSGQRPTEVTGLRAVDRPDDQAPCLLRRLAQHPHVVEGDGLHREPPRVLENYSGRGVRSQEREGSGEESPASCPLSPWERVKMK